ncbi:enoyl-CoA hydratase [Tsukamurella sp. 8F]|uniref:enoyl-CoA hydratase n=1 Tax=unclassified Tsukamurella TaxID=2633480 RepID=UPI0023B944B1|nr:MULTISPECIES: enoyl-CoA hydratase [unclassified Tsukamurella]MDF0529791.1 enoyl-CoA hydratase [Tsukamurella sp. 8J]MDF0586983.1 enoyl-CoA hydratase [Tsukamurella sp. 8F]
MIGYTREDRLAVIEFQRPEARNALNPELMEGLVEAFDRAEADDVFVIVLTGQGSAFCAGADLRSGAVLDKGFMEGVIRFYARAERMKQIVVAALNGPAVGAGVQMAMMADLRVLDPSASIAIPAAKLGVTIDKWTLRRLENLVGGGHARSVLMAAKKLEAPLLEQLGFANMIGDTEAAIEYARGLTKMAPLSLQNYKALFKNDYAREQMSAVEADRLHAVWDSEDLKEALAARFEKREPVFKGK